MLGELTPKWGINSPRWQRLKGKFNNHQLILVSENSDLTITCKRIQGDKSHPIW